MMNIDLLKEAQKRGHEQVTFFNYPQVGLRAVVGIHNTALGPALGGCRLRLYEDETNAVDDALRLSEGMTYKSALAGLDLGGGKAVIIVDPAIKEGRRELFLQFGRCLNALAGRYITAEDMGSSVEDMMVLREVTNYAAGYPQSEGGSGDPSPWTARGVFYSIQAVCERQYGTKDLKDRHVAIQGAGHVGMILLELLKEAGAKVTITDTESSVLELAKGKYEAEVVDIDKIYDVDCDVYAPCAVGQTVNVDTIPRLKCDMIIGAANNILSDSSVYPLLNEKGILYCPDFVVNAGGIISVGAEYIKDGWNESWVAGKTSDIAKTIIRVLDESKRTGEFTEVVAVKLAQQRVKEAEEKCKAGQAGYAA